MNARRVLCGGDENSLENTFGGTLPDGAQCFVIEAQANYRYLQNCKLPDDGEYIVMPKGDRRGRWVRAEGLVGFALLEGGKLNDGGQFSEWKYQKLVQFEVTPKALVYVGSIPRLAHFTAYAWNLAVSVTLLQGDPRPVAMGIAGASTSGAALIHPGERIVCMGAGQESDKNDLANLQVILA